MLEKVRSSQFKVELKSVDRLSVGLEHIAEGEIDVILLDLMLPDSHGLHTFREISNRASKVPIVIMSGIDDEDVAIEAVGEGAQDYLVRGQVDSNLLKHSILYSIKR